MIEVKASNKVQTAGKERLAAMDGLRQTVTAIPKRKIGMAMMALFGMVAYIKTLFGGSEVAAQAAPDTPHETDEKAAPICETDNSAADNSGSMSFGNAELFQAAARDGEQGEALTSPFSVQFSASSGLQPQRLDVSAFQPNPVNIQPAAGTTGPQPGPDGGGVIDPVTPPAGGGGGDGGVTPPPPTGPDPDDNGGDGGDGGGDGGDGTPTDPQPPVTPPVDGGKDDMPCDQHDVPCDSDPCAQDGDADAPCDKADTDCDVASDCDVDQGCDPIAGTDADCDTYFECDVEQGCDPFAGTDADCFEDPLLATRDITFGLPTADDLVGTYADDLIHAGDGADAVEGGAGDDLLIGAAGDDILTGGIGNDRLSGGQGGDTLDGGVGDDILTGDAGDDLLWDGTGADFLFGGDGNDTIYWVADDAHDVVEGGAGIDTLDLSAAGHPAHVDIAAGTITRPALQQDSFASIEIFTAGTGKEVFDLSGLFSPGASAAPHTVFQITDFGHDDTLVLNDDIHLALSDLHAVTDTRAIRKDNSDFEARISAFDPETVAETHGRPGFRQDDQDALMIRRIELRQEHETGEIEFDLWISGPDRESEPSLDFTS